MINITLNEIKNYLSSFKEIEIDETIPNMLEELKQVEVDKGNHLAAKEIWCIEQIYKIKKGYVSAYKFLLEKEFYKAWCEFDIADIELSFLVKHFDISDNKYDLRFISDYIKKFKKLFPYVHFSSRESIIKKERCNICNKVISLRKRCGHVVGEIYDGEMCGRIVEDFEILGVAIVKNPFDNYAVLFPEGLEYNYKMLENLMENLINPFESWDLEILNEKKPLYKNIKRNDPCACGSNKKYKKCCYTSGNDLHDHYRITFLEKNKNFQNPQEIVGTWK